MDVVLSGRGRRWASTFFPYTTLFRSNHGVGANAHKLVNGTRAAYYRPIFYLHFAGNLHTVGNDTVVADFGIVSQGGVGHQQGVVARLGEAFGGRTAVDGHVLTYCGAVANFDGAVCACAC